jgi:GTP-binding protein
VSRIPKDAIINLPVDTKITSQTPSGLPGITDGLPVVVLVGRANAGKSTLFNRITRRGRAIVSAVPGTTRDLNMHPAEHLGRRFTLIDSGGLELGERQVLSERVAAGALQAVGAADVVVFVVDGRAGLSPADAEALDLIRAAGRPTLLAVNKLDSSGQDVAAAEFHTLGLDGVFPVSAAHGRGLEELLDAVVDLLAPQGDETSPAPNLRIALIGRPNVGKSSLLNRLVGAQRSLVDAAPGTTRDPVDVRVKAGDQELVVVDTAGIRRPTRVEGELEHHSVRRAIETIRRAEVLLLVVDASEGITDQDVRLARLVESENRALIVLCNKWDVAAHSGRKQAAFTRDAHQRYPFLEFAPLIYTSARTGDGVRDVLPEAVKVGANFRATFQTALLNRILEEAAQAMDPPVVARRRLNLLYVTQVASSPPRLVFFSNLERDIPAHYVRFLENRFRAALGLSGTPLRMVFRKRGTVRQAAAGPSDGSA